MIRVVIGLMLCLAAWSLVLRRGALAQPVWAAPRLAAVLDTTPILLGFAALLAATARPLLSGLVIAALAGGLSLADRVKRIVLSEPVVFADRAELLEVVRHPSLYLPFAGSAWVLAGAGVAIVAFAGLLGWLESALWARSTLVATAEAAAAAAMAFACFAVPAGSPTLLRRLARLYTDKLGPTRDAIHDSAAFGPLACFAIHATIAASERPGRRRDALVHGTALPPMPSDAGPIVLVQAESFFDPARLHPALGELLPHFSTLAATATQRGCLEVPAWGANTVRSEFAVLTGLPKSAVGLDCFNPYEAFAQAAGPDLPSLARAARAGGYRSVFVHPFDLRFYGRSRVMPRLGFDELVGPEAFAQAERRGDWVADEAVAKVVEDVLRRCGPRTFVFAATMEAHGPWGAKADPGKSVPLPDALHGTPEAAQVAQWLWHLQGTDRLMLRLRNQIAAEGQGWLAVYGDHQPSLPAAFAAAGFTDRRSDYLIWTPGAREMPPSIADIAASDLAAALVSAITARQPATSAARI